MGNSLIRANYLGLKMASRIAAVVPAVLAPAALAVKQKMAKDEVDAKCASADYPPCGLSAGVRALPQWIQLGCGSSEYICAERGATFSADNPQLNSQTFPTTTLSLPKPLE